MDTSAPSHRVKLESHWIILAVLMSAFAVIVSIYWLTRRNRMRIADHSPRMSPDTVSSLFPDRPIRPLPKRRLRETLSPEIADSIKYPPSAHDNVPLFYYPPYTPKDEASPPSIGSLSPVERSRRSEFGASHAGQRNGVRSSRSEDDTSGSRSTLVTRSPPDILTRSSRRLSRLEQSRNTDPPPPPSATSSVDGYDSFENTNNKKKRKIPSAGDTALNVAHTLNGDFGSLASSGREHSPSEDPTTDRSFSVASTYTGTSPFMPNPQGISGSGRGRLGRARNGRSPLRALSDGNNTWAGRASKAAAPQWAQPGFSTLPYPSTIRSESGHHRELLRLLLRGTSFPATDRGCLMAYSFNKSLVVSTLLASPFVPMRERFPFHSLPGSSSPGHYVGIISSAIANAEKLPPEGQENVSLLEQHSMAKTTPASTQFTFTCDSQVPGTVQWPGHMSRHNMGTQTASASSPVAHANSSANHDGSSKAPSGGSAHSRRKARRRLERELLLAARHRRQLAADSYYHNPPKPEDVWICEFCEYERIFGQPPRALIREYEIKDRRHRQEEADRKRLLEKAKAKGRKNRKASKAAGKGATTVNHATSQSHAQHIEDEGAPPMHQGHSHSTQSEEDYEDEFDDDYSNPPPNVLTNGLSGGATPILPGDNT
ncbi:hypothetical protein HJFPF1_04914 [Paramyrothecium foliicola]|nr:hypothetical protein HJFPF1_04914 [Paramyrothecium foliicola]